MMKTLKLSVYPGARGQSPILEDVDFQAYPGDLMAIVGPSGCGKSTFLKAIAGLSRDTTGQIMWMSREIAHNHDIEPEMLAYVPQFAIFHEDLTVNEILSDAAIVRLGRLGGVKARALEVAHLTGLSDLLHRKAKVLSGGQKRRLALAVELVSEPLIILADEVTSGLDPKSAFEITTLLRELASEKKKIVLHVTHELTRLGDYDGVLFLNEGKVAFRGTPAQMLSYFGAVDFEDVFHHLSMKPDAEASAWTDVIFAGGIDENISKAESFKRKSFGARWNAQFFCLARRRFRIFLRSKGQLVLQLLLLIVFPSIVVLFALKGLPEIQNMSMNLETNPTHVLKETLDYSLQVGRIGKLVSGLAMFQVILLALMGANNGAREIAAERGIFEKEKLSGLSTSAYLISKILFLALLVMAQSLWMTILVKEVCELPGNFFQQFIILGLVNCSLTSLSLAISAWAQTAEQASLIALYTVGFQLPLSGAVLALPNWLAELTRPMVAAYWSWSGYLQTLKDSRFYDLIVFTNSAPLDTWVVCVLVLIVQTGAFLTAAFFGCYRSSLSE